MRTAIFALTLTLAAGLLQSPQKPAPKPDVGAGRIAWFDITTSDLAKSKEFYGKLFDWTFTAPPKMANLAVEIVSHDKSIGTLRRAEGQISAFNGVVYVQVDDAQVACTKAKELGATVVAGFPFDLDDGRGAIGLFTDPSGHPMGVYSQKALAPAAPKGK